MLVLINPPPRKKNGKLDLMDFIVPADHKVRIEKSEAIKN